MSQVRFGIKPAIFTLAIALLVFADSTAHAQRKGGFGGRMRGGFQQDMLSLAGNEQVQDELKINDEQREQIEKVLDSYNGDLRDLRPDTQGLSDEEAAKKLAEMNEKRQQLTADTEKKLIPILKEDQVKRLREITLQVQGPRAILRSDFADALKLNDDQKSKIKAIFDAEDQERRSAFGGGGGRRGGKGAKGEKRDGADKGENADKGDKGAGDGDRKAAMEKMLQQRAERRKQTEDAVKKVLTEDQQKQLESLKGAKFEMQMPQRRRGGDQ